MFGRASQSFTGIASFSDSRELSNGQQAGLTELEGLVLGVIRLKGPCTPYAVRCEFWDSIRPHWSASAGAIYPLVARLTRLRLLRIARPLRDGSGGKLYMLTAAGERSFLDWLGPPFSLLHLTTRPHPHATELPQRFTCR